MLDLHSFVRDVGTCRGGFPTGLIDVATTVDIFRYYCCLLLSDSAWKTRVHSEINASDLKILEGGIGERWVSSNAQRSVE
jgi:hypothetical protein